MRKYIMIFFIIGFISCEEENPEMYMVDLDDFRIQLPNTWSASRLQGYDSFVGQITINQSEVIFFDLGWYSDKLQVDPETHVISFVVIDNKNAKIVSPKNFGLGTVGIYFDSLEVTKTNKFQMSGTNLSSANQKLFLDALETIRFKK